MNPEELDPAAVALAVATLRAEGTEEADHAAAELLHLIGDTDVDDDGEPDEVTKAMSALSGEGGGALVAPPANRLRRKRKRTMRECVERVKKALEQEG